jgi:ADP-ribosylglycohydrolase
LELATAHREVRAILLGAALGDALGWPVEFLHWEGIRGRFGPQGIADVPVPALITDDTEMTIAVGRALAQSGERASAEIMETVAREYVRWLDTHNPQRAPGSTCIAGARALKLGVDWRESGVPHGVGCGAAMRVASIGYLYQHDSTKLREVAAFSAGATHGAPSAIAAAVGAAFAVKYGLDGVASHRIAERVIAEMPAHDPQVQDVITRFERARHIPSDRAAISTIGLGWTGHEAIFMALLCVERQPRSFVKALRLAANIDGDSDSVASIVGGIQGARLGLSALPARWLENLERRSEIEELSTALAEKKAELLRSHRI